MESWRIDSIRLLCHTIAHFLARKSYCASAFTSPCPLFVKMITQKVVLTVERCVLSCVITARDAIYETHLGNRISTPARNPLFFHWNEIVPSSVVIETVESKRITKRWEKHGWLPRPRFVVDGLQIVLCDDRRPEEPANISRRTIGRGSIRIPGTNERSIGGHR